MPAVVEAVQHLGDDLGDAVRKVGDVAGDALKVVGDAAGDALKVVGDAAGNTIKAAIDDPIGTIAKVATAIVAPELLPVVNIADNVAHGQDLGKAVLNAGVSYVTGNVANEITSGLTNNLDLGDVGNEIAKDATSGAVKSVLSGQNPLCGAVNSVLNSQLNKAANDIYKGITSGSVGSADNTSVGALPADQVAALNVDNADIGCQVGNKVNECCVSCNACTSPLCQVGENLPQECTIDTCGPDTCGPTTCGPDTCGPMETCGPTDTCSPDICGPIETCGPTETCGPEETCGKESDCRGCHGCCLPEACGGCCCCCCESSTGKIRLPGIKIKIGDKSTGKSGSKTTGGLPATKAAATAPAETTPLGIPWLNTSSEMLVNQPNAANKELGATKIDEPISSAPVQPILHGRGIMDLDACLAQLLRQKGYGDAVNNMVNPYGAGFASGGSAGCLCLNNCSKYMPKFVCCGPDTLKTSLSASRKPMTLNQLHQLHQTISPLGNMGGLAQGGLPHKYAKEAPKGHNPEFVTGLTGYYACGGGTGQSDDIPAMLHDGDYVMDADVVAALGDGSSKAGREILDGFRKQVPHKDSAGGKPVPAKIADGEYVFPAGFVSALGGGDNQKGAKILDGLREKLRAHKRSAPTSKIPPKAKSPLDYIKGAKG